MPSVANSLSTPIGGVINGGFTPANEHYQTLENYINTYTEGLVLIREQQLFNKTTGTLWYRGKVLGFTVEDKVRFKKVRSQTAIADSIDSETQGNIYSNPNSPPSVTPQLSSGAHYLSFRTTGNPKLTRMYVKFPGDKYSSEYKNPGVFPNISDREGGNSVSRDNLNFGGVRIHSGKNQDWSDGCILFGRQRGEDGGLPLNTPSIGPNPANNKGDVEGGQLLTKFIYRTFNFDQGKRFARFLIFNSWEFPSRIVNPAITGTVINAQTKESIENVKLQSIKRPKVKYDQKESKGSPNVNF